tara:strand:- start:2111 stop:2917 length:807 start_codon:yes stop_codon:yes gene_type:complete
MKISFPPKKNKKSIEDFFIKKGLKSLVDLSKGKPYSVNEFFVPNPIMPVLDDLYNLYHYVFLNKRTTVLEFGSGWSSLILNLALKDLKDKYFEDLKKLRRNNPFELFIVENEKKFMKISKDRILKYNKIHKIKKPVKTKFLYTDVEMTLFNDRIATHYKKLPLCNPDFIYLDGPNQFNVKKDINGISTRHKDMMLMGCDILKFEYFYTPGTIIVSDGRAANIKFLRDNFKRKWKYFNDKKSDQHILWLDDTVWGRYNQLQLNFYKNKF